MFDDVFAPNEAEESNARRRHVAPFLHVDAEDTNAPEREAGGFWLRAPNVFTESDSILKTRTSEKETTYDYVWCKLWLPGGVNTLAEVKTPIAGGVVMCHGLGEYSDRYNRMARRYSDGLNALVFAFDHRGFGRTEARKPKEAQRKGVTRMEWQLRDTDRAIQYVYAMLTKEAHLEDPKIFLFGHSMGGMNVLSYAFKGPAALSTGQRRPAFPIQLAGVIASSPQVRAVTPVNPALKYGGWLLAKVSPYVVIDNQIDLNTICRDQAINEAVKNDPLMIKGVCVKMGEQFLFTAPRLIQEAEKVNPALPMLVVHGDADLITR